MPRRLKNGTQVYIEGQPCAVVDYDGNSGRYQVKVQGKEERMWVHDPTEATSSSFHSSSRSGLSSYRKTSTFPATDKKIYYWELPEAVDSFGECFKCGYPSNPTTTIDTVDEGRQEVIKCTNCGTFMRPVRRRRSILDL